MIFYFTGTGNSLDIARKIAENTGDELVSMGDALKTDALSYALDNGENLGFVFPTHCWGTPVAVDDFLNKCTIEVKTSSSQSFISPYTYCVITCGNSIGDAAKDFEKLLEQKGFKLDSSYRIIMPDNYLISLNPPSGDKLKAKLAKVEKEVKPLLEALAHKEKGAVAKRGFLGTLLARINPSFKKYGRSTKEFLATEKCISCGLCVEYCPSEAITLTDGKPVWEGDCALCLACINRCPTQAIEYGKKTIGRNRYLHPCLR